MKKLRSQKLLKEQRKEMLEKIDKTLARCSYN